MLRMNVMIIENRSAHQNPSMSNPGTSSAASRIRPTLITIRNSPMVRMVTGIVRMMSWGFYKEVEQGQHKGNQQGMQESFNVHTRQQISCQQDGQCGYEKLEGVFHTSKIRKKHTEEEFGGPFVFLQVADAPDTDIHRGNKSEKMGIQAQLSTSRPVIAEGFSCSRFCHIQE